MKQLLQSFQESHIIVALNHQAVVIAFDQDDCTVTTRLEAPGEDASSEIQAVALTKDGSTMMYAIARSNKRLQIFRGSELVVSYATPKRVSSLCFTSVHDRTGNNKMAVVVVGDLAGDAIAYPIEKEPTDEDELKKKETKCRLLLGHTASMLTKVMVHNNWILTADRDEKIRVSHFPDTHRIHGYLLGHLAFVSSFDVYENRCVSCGGDRMIRVWNLSTSTELASVSTGQDENDDNALNTRLIPTSILWDGSGQFIALLYDESKYVDFFSWQDGSVSHSARVECQAQPLGLALLGSSHFLVLIQDSPFVQEFLMESTDKSRLVMTETTLPTIRCNLEEIAKELEITNLPGSLLERDDSGVVKIEKHNETRGPRHTKPWEKFDRVKVAKERNRRFKRRKRESSVNDDDDDDDDDDNDE